MLSVRWYSVYGNGDEYDGPYPIPLGYKQIDDYEVILKLVEEKVKSTIGALRAYVRTRSTAYLPSSLQQYCNALCTRGRIQEFTESGNGPLFSARQHAERAICYRKSVCLSVCPSVTRVDQSKTVEARIMQFSPYSSPIPLLFTM